MNKKCKNCGEEIGHEGSEMLADRLYIIVDEQVQRLTMMNKGDGLCAVCTKAVTYYQRVK